MIYLFLYPRSGKGEDHSSGLLQLQKLNGCHFGLLGQSLENHNYKMRASAWHWCRVARSQGLALGSGFGTLSHGQDNPQVVAIPPGSDAAPEHLHPTEPCLIDTNL